MDSRFHLPSAACQTWQQVLGRMSSKKSKAAKPTLAAHAETLQVWPLWKAQLSSENLMENPLTTARTQDRLLRSLQAINKAIKRR